MDLKGIHADRLGLDKTSDSDGFFSRFVCHFPVVLPLTASCTGQEVVEQGLIMTGKNKWLIALCAVGIHISIGSVYAFSVLTKPLMAQMGFSLAEITWTFSLAILFLGLSAGFLGTVVENVGPKVSGLVSAFFFCTGLLGSALAGHQTLIPYSLRQCGIFFC